MAVACPAVPASSQPVSHTPSVFMIGAHCRHSVNIYWTDELIHVPTLCAFPQLGLFLSHLSICWLLIMKPSFRLRSWWLFSLPGKDRNQQPSSQLLFFFFFFAKIASITSFHNCLLTYLFSSPACELLKVKDEIWLSLDVRYLVRCPDFLEWMNSSIPSKT